MAKLSKVKNEDRTEEQAKEYHELKKDESRQVSTEQIVAKLSKWESDQVAYVNNESKKSHITRNFSYELESHERWLEVQNKYNDEKSTKMFKQLYFLFGVALVFTIIFFAAGCMLEGEVTQVEFNPGGKATVM